MPENTFDPDDDRTIPSRKFPVYPDPMNTAPDAPVEPAHPADIQPPPASAPWLLRQHYNAQINLRAELNARFPSLPVMSVLRFRALDTRHGLALVSTMDGMAALVVDANAATGVLECTFSFASMLSLRFHLDRLSPVDRAAWLERMRHDREAIGFLWGEARWERDYLIGVRHNRFINLYAFSPHNFEAAARLTPDAAQRLLDWLEGIWKTETPEEPPQILTW